jgi:hypothetical protein
VHKRRPLHSLETAGTVEELLLELILETAVPVQEMEDGIDCSGKIYGNTHTHTHLLHRLLEAPAKASFGIF